ncbi:MAG: response regulator [Desulfatiglans sp.]|nr:response regulator [Desulfatiglans sp.]
MLSFLIVDDKENLASELRRLLAELFPGCTIKQPPVHEEIINALDDRPDLIFVRSSIEAGILANLLKKRISEKETSLIPVVLLVDELHHITLFDESIKRDIEGIVTWPLNKYSVESIVRSMIRLNRAESELKARISRDETNGSESAEEIRKYQERHEGIFENTINAIAIYRPQDSGNDFIIVEFNRAAEKIEKVKRGDIVGKRVTEVFPGVIEFGLIEVFRRVLKTGIPERHPVRFYKDSRIVGWRENYVYRLPSDEIVAVYTDETKHKVAEIALMESEERFRQLAEYIQEVFWVVSPDWKEVYYISPAYEKVWGLSCESLYKNPVSWSDSIIKEDRDIVLSYLKEKTKGDVDEIIFPEYRIIHSDFSIHWISARGYPVYNEEGKLYRIVGIAEDVTEKKQSDKAFNAILEGTSWVTGQDFFDKIVRELSIWLDCDVAIIGKVTKNSTIESISIIREGKLSKVYSYPLKNTPCMEVIKKGYFYHPVGLKEHFSEAVQLHDLDITGFVGIRLLNKEEEPIGVLAAMSKDLLILPKRAEDVMKILAARTSAEIERMNTEEKKKQVEALLQQAQKMEAIGTLAGGIAHDFNNILQSIMLNTELAQFENSGNNVVQHRMDEVLKASKRATDLVKQILTFSRQSEIELRPLKISLVIKEALKMLRSSLPSTIEMSSSISTEDDLALADPTQIHQVVMNLCTNAAHAMREKGGTLSVNLEPVFIQPESTSLYPELLPGPYVCMKVSDTGHGIDKNLIDRIFDPFFTTKERGEGTGLGLAVVYGIIKELKGTIRVESEKGMGATFTILLPRIQRPHKTEAAEANPIPHGTETMLLVDDEEGLLVAQKKIFERLGYKVETHSSSTAAFEVFKRDPKRFDIVITDQTMPKMTGAQLAKEFMTIRPDIPIILCTGFSDVISEEEAKAIGIKEFIMKPIVISDIACKVRKILDK